MNILVISGQRWCNNNSLGNTLSNLFENWPANVSFSNIYCRAGAPSNKVCDYGFQILSQDIIKNFLRPQKIGCIRKTIIESEENTRDVEKENSFISLMHKTGLKTIYHINNVTWRSGVWKNKKLEDYITENNPDIIFAFAIGVEENYQLIKHVKEKTDAKLVLFILDDVLGDKNQNETSLQKEQRKNVTELLHHADLIYAISSPMCEAYEKIINRNIRVLHKGAEIDSEIKQGVNSPLKMVYAGNLLYGRKATLLELSKSVDRLNSHGIKILFDLYSTTTLDKETIEQFSSNVGVHINSARPYSEIKEILKTSDIVLHIESFEKKEIEKVRYSFSTKIVDCLQSGSVTIGIGPKEIASMEYLAQVPGSIVINDLKELDSSLFKVISNPKQLISMAQNSKAFAKEHLDIKQIRANLSKDLQNLIEM